MATLLLPPQQRPATPLVVIAKLTKSLIYLPGLAHEDKVARGFRVLAVAGDHDAVFGGKLARREIDAPQIPIAPTEINPRAEIWTVAANHRGSSQLNPNFTVAYTIDTVFYDRIAAGTTQVSKGFFQQLFSLFGGFGQVSSELVSSRDCFSARAHSFPL